MAWQVCFMSSYAIKLVDEMILSFFRNNKRLKLSKDVTVQLIVNGGIKEPSFNGMVKTNGMSSNKRLLSHSK